MRNNIKQNWVVIYYSGEYSLVTIRDTKPECIYWHGGPSYMYYDNSMKIVKDYGWIYDEDDEKLSEIELDFLKNFNPYKKSEPIHSAGWIAPNGDYYACDYGIHDTAADHLAAICYDSFDGVRELEKNKWVRLSDGGLFRSWEEITKKQYEKLWDICNAEENPDVDPGFTEELLEYLKDAEVKEGK